MHVTGAPGLGLAPNDTFPGRSLFAHLDPIRRLVQKTGAKTILDYGSGKGLQYRAHPILVDGRAVADSVAEYWDVDEVRCYDPGYEPYAALPADKFDGVISTDVLEHCPEDDLAWILDEAFAFARRFVYLNVACFPARKSLPNGENAHATVRPPEWWRELVAERARQHDGLLWELHAAYSAGGNIAEKIFSSADSMPQAHGAVTAVSLEGLRAFFGTPNDMTRWRAESLYTKEPVTIEWLRAMPAGSVFLDVGANVGLYTVFAALAREARVFAFEPESQNYALLNENLRLNGLGDKVTAICAGLSDRSGVSRLYLSQPMAGGSCHSLGAEVGFRLEPRPAAFAQGAMAVRFDELVAAGDVPVPGYIKIDVDGFEHKVIAGMERTLRDESVRSLIVELNPALSEHREVREHLATMGFRWDADQVAAAARKTGPFKGVAEHVFRR
ncbi:MAG TPA: FkbM family methyltransferase [Burkholderiales bacterium]|nr:FkbM family methyltransferase [Burkholderiales bacterium]